MDFRLIYRGPLPAGNRKSGRTEYKHRIRKEFHKQLRELWKQHPDLRSQQANSWCFLSHRGEEGSRYVFLGDGEIDPANKGTNVKRYIDYIADDHLRCGGRFVPLISLVSGFTCSLHVLFLRRGNPGDLILHGTDGGDIDNRIKVLLDGLKMPETEPDLGGIPLDSDDENPFFCLLEDDSLITNLSVTTDRLLTPLDGEEKLHDVHLVVHVTMVNPGAIFAGNKLV